MIDQIAEEYEGSVKVAKANVDAEQELAVSFGISSTPTIALFEPGQQPRAVVGALSKEGAGEDRVPSSCAWVRRLAVLESASNNSYEKLRASVAWEEGQSA